MTKPFMDEDLRSHVLRRIMDVLAEDDAPLTVPQVQLRLARDHGMDKSRKEIEAHLDWGHAQPRASQNLKQDEQGNFLPPYMNSAPTPVWGRHSWRLVPAE